MMYAKKFTVVGIVQGVGFRYFTKNYAVRIGIKGYVKNLPDGSVEVYAVGSEKQLDDIKNKLNIGPAYSRVDKVIEKNENIDKQFLSFYIRY